MHVAYVLLPQFTAPDADAISAAYRELFPGRGPLVPSGEAVDEDGTPAVALAGEDGAVHVVGVGDPVVADELPRSVERSLASIGQETAPPDHAAHLVVAWFPAEGSRAVDALQAQARVTAAVALATGGSGVYVGAASVTHPAEWYVEVAREVEDLVMLWIGVSHAVDEQARHSFLSFGMHGFGLPDLLLTAPLDEGADALEFFYALLGRAAEHGVMIDAGETVGRTPEERIPVRLEANPVDDEMVVMRVDLPAAAE